MRFQRQEGKELACIWKLLRYQSRVFTEYDQFQDFVRRGGNHVYLSDAGVIAILGRWRPHLSCLVIWELIPAVASRAPAIKDLIESVRGEGFQQLASSLLTEEGKEPYLEAGFQEFESIVKMEKKGLDCPRVHGPALLLPAEEGHLELLVELEREAFPPFWWLDEESFRQFLKGDHFLVALLKGRMVGYNISNILGKQGTIYRLGVLPSFQSQGIGSQLLAEALHWFADQGVGSVVLTTQESNREGRRLYEKFGFKALRGKLHILRYDY